MFIIIKILKYFNFRLVLAKFDEIKDRLEPEYRKYHNLAGIVLWDRIDPNKSYVVSIAAGSISLPKKLIELRGKQLHDMHAEVLARRALLLFLYEQISAAQRKLNCIC